MILECMLMDERREGRQEGRQEGKREERRNNIQIMITTLKELGVSVEDIVEKVTEKYAISRCTVMEIIKQQSSS